MALTESTNLGDWLVWEQDNRYSRKDVDHRRIADHRHRPSARQDHRLRPVRNF